MNREQTRDRKRVRYARYVYNPNLRKVEKLSKWIPIQPMIVYYIPHYEHSLRMEFPVPKSETGDARDLQSKLSDYKQIFVNWFGRYNSTARRFEQWNKQTRLWAYKSVRSKGAFKEQMPEQSRALKTLLLYPNILNKFQMGKKRSDIAKELAQKSEIAVPKFKLGKPVPNEFKFASRKETTIQRDISALTKMGILKRTGRGIYEVARGF